MATIENVIVVIADALRYDFYKESEIPKILIPSHEFPCLAWGTETKISVPVILTGLPETEIKTKKDPKKLPKEEPKRDAVTGTIYTSIDSPTFFSILEKVGYHTAYINIDASDELLHANQFPLFLSFPNRGTLADMLNRYRKKLGIVLHFWDMHAPYGLDMSAKEAEKHIVNLFRYGESRRRNKKDTFYILVFQKLKPLLQVLSRLGLKEYIRRIFWSSESDQQDNNKEIIYKIYRNAISIFVSRHLKPLLEILDLLKLKDKTLIVLVSDHGELLGEHGRFFHCGEMAPELRDVPLIFYHPDFKERIHNEIASHLDVLPTILKLLNLPIPKHLKGKILIKGAIASPTLKTEQAE